MVARILNEYVPQDLQRIRVLFYGACCFIIKSVIFSSRGGEGETARREGDRMIDAIFIRIKLTARPIARRLNERCVPFHGR